MGGFFIMKRTKPRKLKQVKRENNTWNIFLSVQIFAVIIYLIVFFIGAFAAMVIDLSSKNDYIFSLLLFAVCSFATGFFAGIKRRENGLIIGVLSASPLNSAVVILSLIFNSFSVDSNIIITVLVLIAASGAGGILAVNKRIRR